MTPGGRETPVALIGCGRIAGHHARALRDTDGVRLAAVCDRIEEKARAYGTEFGVPHYTDYRPMLERHPEIQIVAVITPSGMHFEHAMELLERYKKHVIVEKPTFLKPSHLERAYAAARSAGLEVFPVFQNRYNRAVVRVKKALDDGELGKPRLLSVRVRWCRPQRYYELAPWRGTYSQDGGALTNQGIHHVDLLRFLGGEVERVVSSMRTLGADIEVEDTVVGTVQFRGGALGTVEVTTAARPIDYEASISIVGEKGLAQIGGIAVNELQVFTPDPDECAASSEDFSGCIYGYGHAALYRDVTAFFGGGVPFPMTREDCLGSIRLLQAFYRSDETGSAVNPGDGLESTRLGRPDEELAALYRTPEPEGRPRWTPAG